MKTLFTTLSILLFSLILNAQDTISISDFDILNNTSWKGKLTYKDYQSGKPSTVDATLQIKIEGEKINSSVQYTYEPNKNHNSSVKIKKNGTYYGNEKVVSNTIENGTRTIITTYEGRDNGEKATFYMIHIFNKNEYTETKEVVLKNTNERFVRNTYSFTKI